MNPAISQVVNRPALQDFHSRLRRWYGRHGRKSLPWRTTADAYAIYVSEIMLQQTQVATVLERYYFPFLKRFPTLSALAAAPQDQVLSAWQGLGYYNRALNLHKAAKVCRGALPQTVDGLLALPGVGRNTAHAVAAFAFHRPVAVMEANVKRVMARLFALKHPTENELWEKAGELLDTAHPFDYNQAMMDIGAMLCTRRTPRCGECPAQHICMGKASPEAYPAARRKKTPPVRQKQIIVLRNAAGKYFAVPRTGKFLSGLYHFVELESSSRRKPGPSPTKDFIAAINAHKKNWVPAFAGMTRLGRIRQQYSHFTLDAEVWLAQTGSGGGTGWHSPAQLAKLPMSMAEQKILALLRQQKPAKPKRKKRGL